MNDMSVTSFWVTMDRGFAPHHSRDIGQDSFHVHLARGLSASEAAHCMLGSGDHREAVDESPVSPTTAPQDSTHLMRFPCASQAC